MESMKYSSRGERLLKMSLARSAQPLEVSNKSSTSSQISRTILDASSFQISRKMVDPSVSQISRKMLNVSRNSVSSANSKKVDLLGIKSSIKQTKSRIPVSITRISAGMSTFYYTKI